MLARPNNSVRVTSSHQSVRNSSHPAQDAVAPQRISPTMSALDREVAKLPKFPMSAPLPDAHGHFHDRPCSVPQRWKGYPSWNPVCVNCGFFLMEHTTKDTRHV
jgi:hypothetical protein